MTDTLQVEKRNKLGSAATQRLRRDGHVPAVLYGHGRDNEHLAIPEKDINFLVRQNLKMVKLTGAIDDTALVSDIQFDPLGIDVLHLDLIRVNLKETVEVTVPIHLHGQAPGVAEGGVLLENEHEVEISCPAGSIPDQLELDVNGLQLGENLSAGDLVMPEGVTLVTPPETVVAHIEEPRAEEEVAEESVAGEPEVITREAEGEEGEESSDKAEE